MKTQAVTPGEAAFLAGEQANFDGERRNSNPHPDGAVADSWNWGWEAAQCVRDEWEAENRSRAVMCG